MRKPKGLHMAHNMSEQQVLELQRLNDLNCYIFIFLKNPKHIDQDEIIEISYQAKAKKS
jgi:hypothetical protein